MNQTPTRAFHVDALRIQVHANSEALAAAAARQVIDVLNDTLQSQPTAAVVFATGRSQLGLLSHLRQDTSVDWSRVIGFHLDEFLGLSRQHPASFGFYLQKHVVQWLPFQTFHYLDGNALEPIVECDRYTHLLTQQPIDICLLGVGNNGHLAFNDPAVADFNDTRWVKLVQLDSTNRQQQLSSQHFSRLDTVPTYALTLTLKAIRHARSTFCCVFGNNKANILKTLLTVPPSERCPASILRLNGDTNNNLFVDEAAMAGIVTTRS